MLTEIAKEYSLWAIETGGYTGAAIMMALESMIAPVPSEVVMPPLGMLLHDTDRFTWWGAILATSIGSLIGSLISYYLGMLGGKPLVMKVGKYLLLNEEHLDLTTKWFAKHGAMTVLVSRFIPVVRHFISIPACIARMNLLKFCIYTVIGATLWNTSLLCLGYGLAKHWVTILEYRGYIDVAIVIGLAGAVVAWYWIHLRKPKGTTKV